MNTTKTNQFATKRMFTTKEMVLIGLLSALAYVLMLVKFPYKHLGFLELELSDVPAIVAGIIYGPLAGVVVEFIKNLIKVVTASTTGGVGELANFVISIAYIIPVSLLFRKTNIKFKAITAFTIGTISMMLAGCLVNYFVTLPLYAKLFGGMDVVVGAAAANVPMIHDMMSLIIVGITPFNLVKGIVISIAGYFTYKAVRNSL